VDRTETYTHTTSAPVAGFAHFDRSFVSPISQLRVTLSSQVIEAVTLAVNKQYPDFGPQRFGAVGPDAKLGV